MLRAFLILVLAGAIGALPLSPETEQKVVKKATESDSVALDLDLQPPKVDAEDANFAVDILDENTTLSTELLPPKEDKDEHHGTVFIINLFAVKNVTDGDAGEVLSDEIKEKVPAILEPVATILLVVEEDDENTPVSLDDLAKDLEEEGIMVEKIGDDIDTKVIKLDFEGEMPSDDPHAEFFKPKQLNKIRRRRSPHLLRHLLEKKYGGGGGGGCDVCNRPPPPCTTCGGGGGHYGSIVTIPIEVVPVQTVQYEPRPVYRPQPVYHEPPQPIYQEPPRPVYHEPPRHPNIDQCDPCNGRGGGGGGGHRGSWSQSSAQASAQSSSGSW